MLEDNVGDSLPSGEGVSRHDLFAEKPTIKILLYTDDPNEATPNNAIPGVGSLMQRLEARQPAFANVRVDRVSRSSGPQSHADNKIDDVLRRELNATGQTYDEIWFFGFHQARLEKFSLGANRGGPESELNENEVSTLRGWMAAGDELKGAVGGGVLMTGDHSDTRPQGIIPSINPSCPPSDAQSEFLGLGRALGRCVPRAGVLRQWDGGPTTRDQDRFSTIASSGLQDDSIPQPLLHRNVNADGEPDPNGQSHPLFFYKQGRLINVFPDHKHEGAVIVPEGQLNPNEWPVVKDQAGNDVQPRPHVIAYGFDSRRGQLLNLIAAYDGDRVNVGRIVADSTWHHYLNLNLTGFPDPAPDGSDSDQIGQFYANLTLWLAPMVRRRQMALAMCWRLATLSLLLEGTGDVLRIGSFAFSALSQVASPCEINEMIRAIAPEKYKTLCFPDGGSLFSPIPPKELLLGSVLRSYQEEIIKAESEDASFQPRAAGDIIEKGFKDAFNEMSERLSQMAFEANNL
jgi:hypothetical protein